MFGSGFKITIGALVVAVFVAMAVFAPMLAPFDPLRQDLFNRLGPPFGPMPAVGNIRWARTTMVATCCPG